jgi:hypothetical protein
MLRKILIGSIIISFINYIGCYSLEVINKNDIEENRFQLDISKELYLTTKDSLRYHFLPANFQIVDDTLYGKGSIENPSSTIPFQGKIAFIDITSFEQRTPDTIATIGLSVGIITVGLVVLGLAILAAFGNALNPN